MCCMLIVWLTTHSIKRFFVCKGKPFWHHITNMINVDQSIEISFSIVKVNCWHLSYLLGHFISFLPLVLIVHVLKQEIILKHKLLIFILIFTHIYSYLWLSNHRHRKHDCVSKHLWHQTTNNESWFCNKPLIISCTIQCGSSWSDGTIFRVHIDLLESLYYKFGKIGWSR